MILSVTVTPDEFTKQINKYFDYNFTGESTFIPWEKPIVPSAFKIGVIYGSSGSGKSTLLKEFGNDHDIDWDPSKPLISHFKNPDDSIDKLSGVGLNSIPTWCKPYHVLSTGEKFRADMARKLKDNAVIDEFTSVVNRSVAKAVSVSLKKYINRTKTKNIVVATCHDDILEWLEPDWTFNCDTGKLSVGRYLQRPQLRLCICKTHWSDWEMFKNHHYLSSSLNKCVTCFVGFIDNEKIGFSASIPMPSKIPPLFEGDKRKKYRESRTVLLPDYQGMGLGVRFSDAVAQIWLDAGYRYFSKTAHIRMGEYRQKVDWWRPTSTNLKSRAKSQKCSKKKEWQHMMLDTKRICYSHEYIGKKGDHYRTLYETSGF